MSTIKSTFARPPFIGLLAFVIVFIVQALGHTVMIAMENIFGEAYVYQSAFALGALRRHPALHRDEASRAKSRAPGTASGPARSSGPAGWSSPSSGTPTTWPCRT